MLLEHIAFNVPDPMAAAAWYAAQFGMRVVRHQTVSPFAHFVVDEGGRSVVEFYNNPGDAVPDLFAVHPLRHHIAFLADDVVTTPAGDRLVFLRDPWGLPIQLVQRARPLL